MILHPMYVLKRMHADETGLRTQKLPQETSCYDETHRKVYSFLKFCLMMAASISWEGGCQFLAPTLENLLDNLNAENWCTAWLSVIVLQLSRLLSSCLSEVTEEVLRRISNNETPEFLSLFEFARGPTGFGCELLNFAFLGWLEFVWSYRMERGIHMRML